MTRRRPRRLRRAAAAAAVLAAVAGCARTVPDVPLVPTTLPVPAPTEAPATTLTTPDTLDPGLPTVDYVCRGPLLTAAGVDSLLAILSWWDGETALGGPFAMSLRTDGEVHPLDVCPARPGVRIPVAGHDPDEIGSAIRALIGARADADPGLPATNSAHIWPSRGPVELPDGSLLSLVVVPDDVTVGGRDPAHLLVWTQPIGVCTVRGGRQVPCSSVRRLADCHDWWPWCP